MIAGPPCIPFASFLCGNHNCILWNCLVSVQILVPKNPIAENSCGLCASAWCVLRVTCTSIVAQKLADISCSEWTFTPEFFWGGSVRSLNLA